MENKSLFKTMLPHRAVKIFARIVAAAILIVLCIYLDSADLVPGIYGSRFMSTVYYYWFYSIVRSGIYGSYFIAAITAIPFAGNFCAEYQQGCWRYVLARTGSVRYTIRKFLLVFLSGGASATLGGWLFVAFTSRFTTLADLSDIANLQGMPYIDLLADKPLLYFAVAIFLFFLAGGLYACIGYTVSAFVPKSYAVYGVPFVFLFALERFYIAAAFPDEWRLDFWLSGQAAPAGGIRFLGMAALRVLVICTAAGFLFHKKLKWRLEHE